MPAPALNATKPTVIDLTESDDEDVQKTWLPFPNHGFTATSSTPLQRLQRKDGSLGRNYTDKIVPSAYRSGARGTEPVTDRRSSKTQADIKSRKALDHNESNVVPAAKRRKLSHGLRAYAENGVGNFSTRGNQEVQISRAKSESSLKSTPNLPAVITGEMRAGSSNQPSILKVAHTSLTKAEAHPEKIELMLEKQVLPYIRTAFRPFNDNISSDERDEIATKVGKDLVDDPLFGDELKANNLSLSANYEIQLSRKAQTLVTQYTREFLKSKTNKPRLALRSSLLGQPKGQVQKVSANSAQSQLDAVDKISTESESSESDEIFELRPHAQVRSSFSPSTPISNDLVKRESRGETPMESIEPPARKVTEDHSDRQRSERSTRAVKPAYISKRRQRRWQKRPAEFDLDSSSAATPAAEQYHDHSSPSATEPNQNQATSFTFRPYLSCSDRKALVSDLERRHASRIPLNENELVTSHIPFSDSETDMLVAFLSKKILKSSKRTHPDPFRQIVHLMSGRKANSGIYAGRIAYDSTGLATVQTLRGRDRASIISFLKDAAEDKIQEYTSFSLPPALPPPNRNLHLSNLLRQREIYGLEPVRVRNGGTSYREEISSFMEDLIVPQSEWTDCSGDIAAITWTSGDTFIVGALAHFDPHNMQYNKPGNLLIGSTTKNSLRAYPDHKIVRPLISEIQNKENALESMRRTQDPWLYASVVCTAHSSVSGYSFTSSYDQTVKTWKISEDGSSMELCGTWEHQARVNFVATSEHHDRVATASETHKDAVRIYNFDKEAISESAYDEYGGNKSQAQSDVRSRQRWAYQPATMKWAKAPKVAHLLLVGYSPRSETGDDSDIPDDKKNTGELCVWDYVDGSRYSVSSSRTSNIFEAVWHPTQQMFAAATSPSGNFDSERTKTQVRIFALNDHRMFTMIMALDCPALDINELTIMPNSTLKCYVTASCTDGNTYVWDTAQGEDPIHVLGHGDSLDNPDPDIPLELADGGVTFASWGATVDRFYTGATDGKLKSWDIRRPPGYALVRNVLELSGGISSGAFSSDFRKLLIGDGTGKVHLLGIDDGDISDEETMARSSLHLRDVLGTSCILPTSIKRPKVIIPHPEPAAPEGYQAIMDENSEQSAQKIGHNYIEEGFLEVHPQGVFQGPNYHELGLYRFEAHEEMDDTKPLLPNILALQQFSYDQNNDVRMRDMPILPKAKPANANRHRKNKTLDFAFNKLSLETQAALEEDEVELDWDVASTFTYEITPRSDIFRLSRRRHSNQEKSELRSRDKASTVRET